MSPIFTLLIVEDTPMTRQTLVRLLSKTCPLASSALADDVAHACNVLRGGHITSVVTDYHLPDGTAMDVIAAVRQHNAHVPIVVMSGDTSVEATVLQAGAVAFVAKPFNLLALAGLLAQLCAN